MAINAKTLEVTFNKAVDDTKAVFAVNKGSVKVNHSKISWNEAKTVATIELTGKISAGEYTVNVTGLSDEALTGKVTAADEKVTTVTLLDDKAPITAVGTGISTVTIGYKVENQYGEDITATTSIDSATAAGSVVRAGTTTATKGLVTIPVKDEVKADDAIVLTLVHTGTGTSVSQTVKVAAKSGLADVAITGVYNKDGKTLTETTSLTTDAFYLLVEGKDQYGNVLKAGDVTGLISNNTNPLIANLNGGQNPLIETITVAGKEVTAIKLVGSLTAGETTVMLISPNTGKNATQKITVAEAQRTANVTLEVPQLVVAGEDLFVPISVTDKDGNAVTDLAVINDPTRGIKVSGLTNTVEVQDGKIGIKVTHGTNLGGVGYKSLVAISSTSKSTVANFEVKAAADATIVTGLKAGNSTTLLAPNGVTTLSVNSLSVEDQYGRVMTPAALTTWLALPGNQIVIKDAATDTVKLDKGTFVVATNAFTTGTIANAPTGVKINVATDAVQVKAGVKGTEKVSITLEKTAGEVATSTKEVNFKVTDGTEYSSYQVDPIGTIFDEVGAGLANDSLYDKKINVYGVLADGSKVALTNTTDYTVSAPVYLDYSSGKIEMDAPAAGATGAQVVPYATGSNEVKANATITINATGQQFTEEVTVSKVKPTVTGLKVVPQATASVANTTAAFNNAKEELEFTSSAFTSTSINSLVNFVVQDSYGVVQLLDNGNDGLLGANIKLVATPAVANTITFTKQNAHDTTFAGLEKGEKFTVAATIGGVSKTFTVTGSFDSVDYNSKAKAAIEGASLTLTNTQGASESTAVTQLETAVNALSITPADGSGANTISHYALGVEIVDVTFVAADPGLTAGSIKFKVKTTKGNASDTTSEITVAIPHS